MVIWYIWLLLGKERLLIIQKYSIEAWALYDQTNQMLCFKFRETIFFNNHLLAGLHNLYTIREQNYNISQYYKTSFLSFFSSFFWGVIKLCYDNKVQRVKKQKLAWTILKGRHGVTCRGWWVHSITTSYEGSLSD